MSGERGRGAYDRPRVLAATVLVALLVALLGWDAVSAEYVMSDTTLALLLGTVLTLLGIEAAQVLRGGKP